MQLLSNDEHLLSLQAFFMECLLQQIRRSLLLIKKKEG